MIDNDAEYSKILDETASFEKRINYCMHHKIGTEIYNTYYENNKNVIVKRIQSNDYAGDQFDFRPIIDDEFYKRIHPEVHAQTMRQIRWLCIVEIKNEN